MFPFSASHISPASNGDVSHPDGRLSGHVDLQDVLVNKVTDEKPAVMGDETET